MRKLAANLAAGLFAVGLMVAPVAVIAGIGSGDAGNVIEKSGTGSVLVEVPDGATRAVATVTATAADGDDMVQAKIRDDSGGWWNGPKHAGESRIVDIPRTIPDGMLTIEFLAVTDGPAGEVTATVRFE